MAQFRGTLKGNRGQASRLGTKRTGLEATANGCNIGVDIELVHNATTEKDELRVWLTGGSNGSRYQQIVTWREGETPETVRVTA
jgi:hypothetical protein